MSDNKSSTGVKLESIQRLIKQAPQFHQLEGPQQAAYRAHLKRYLGRVKDAQIKAALQRVAEYIGESKPPYRGLTVDDLMIEYGEKYDGYDTGQRGAFKAKLTRLMRSLREAGDEAAAKKLAGLQLVISENEDRELRESILELALLIPDAPEDQPVE